MFRPEQILIVLQLLFERFRFSPKPIAYLHRPSCYCAAPNVQEMQMFKKNRLKHETRRI